jgi:hypothetical protein
MTQVQNAPVTDDEDRDLHAGAAAARGPEGEGGAPRPARQPRQPLPAGRRRRRRFIERESEMELEAYAARYGKPVDYSTMDVTRFDIHEASALPEGDDLDEPGQWYEIDCSYVWVADG